MRTKQWLRGFLRLDATREQENIAQASIDLQEDTVLAALELLDRESGVLLADEVGMGKTYQALGLLACMLEGKKDARCIVVTPRPVLNEQWLRVANRFRDMGFYPFPEGSIAKIDHLVDLPAACQEHAVVFTPINVFTSSRSYWERGALLRIWFQQRHLPGPTRAAIRRRLEDGDLQVKEHNWFLKKRVESFTSPSEATFRRIDGDGDAGLDNLLDQGIDAFRNKWAVQRAFSRARYHLVGSLLPNFDLVVVDEAHKLKNPWTVQSQAVSLVLNRRFDKAVFLTATPFQLGVSELRRVFEIFGRARAVRSGFAADVEDLFDGIRSYQDAYNRFEAAWKFVDEDQASSFSSWYDENRDRPDMDFDSVEDPNVLSLARMAVELRHLKESRVERGFRRWTIRNLKPGKRERRNEIPVPLPPTDRSMIPILLYQRLLEARARSGRQTHIAAAQTNIASSFQAARGGALLSDEHGTAEVREYQNIVRQVLEHNTEQHPKVERVVDEIFQAGDRDEKSLVFCERNATIRALRERVEAQWMDRQLRLWRKHYRKATPEGIFGISSGEGRILGEFQKLANRFTKAQDSLTLGLRESYPFTLFVPPGESNLPADLWKEKESLLEDANQILSAQLTSGTSATRPDYRIARRCIDQAVARWFEKNRPEVFDCWDDISPKKGLARALLASDFMYIGLDGVADPEEVEMRGRADTPPQWTISDTIFSAVLSRGRPSIWFPFREKLARFEPALRVLIVDAVRFYLTRREVPFLVELRGKARKTGATSLMIRNKLESNWNDPAWAWKQKVEEFLDYLPRLGPTEQKEVLDDALREGRFVQTTLDAGSRTRRQNAFNTPFYPMVLLGNQTMQEGLDLHRSCRRVVHHDLRWNPADLEQRTGRVDRHGSLSEKLQATPPGEDWQIHVHYPLLERSSDPRQYHVVKEREKWLNFLLGRPPEAGIDDSNYAGWIPLPVALAEDLRVDLSPDRA